MAITWATASTCSHFQEFGIILVDALGYRRRTSGKRDDFRGDLRGLRGNLLDLGGDLRENLQFGE